jgi:large subunit ribosomal protein L35
MTTTAKFKSKKAFTKRFKSTASGKLKRGRANTSHLFGSKSTRQKKNSQKISFLSKNDVKRARKMINYKST